MDRLLLKTCDRETGTGVWSVQYSPDGEHFGYGRPDATVVLAGDSYALRRADLNCDGPGDFGDINPFLALLTGM